MRETSLWRQCLRYGWLLAWLVFVLAVYCAVDRSVIFVMTYLRLGEWLAFALLISCGLLVRVSASDRIHLSDALLLMAAVLPLLSVMLHYQSVSDFRSWVLAGLAWAVWAGWWCLQQCDRLVIWRLVALGGLLLYSVWIIAFSQQLLDVHIYGYALTYREFGFFTVNPRMLGVPFALVLPVLWVFWLEQRKSMGRLALGGMITIVVLMTVIIIISSGRAALLAPVAGLLFATLLFRGKGGLAAHAWRSYAWIFAGSLLAYMVLAYLIFPDALLGEANFIGGHAFSSSDSARFDVWRYGWEQWQTSNIWLGRGMYGLECRLDMPKSLHNLYLQVLLEFGLVGLGLLLAGLSWCGYLLFRLIKQAPDQYSFAGAWMVGAWGLFALVEGGYAFPTGEWMSIWMVLLVLLQLKAAAVIEDSSVAGGRLVSWVLPVGMVLLVLLMYALYLSWQDSMAWVEVAKYLVHFFRPRLWVDDCAGTY